jgi:hypothetical protein
MEKLITGAAKFILKVKRFKMRKIWWKILCIVIIFYVIVMGIMGPVPRLAIINESIRNTYFHVRSGWQ